jgi:UDP-N-acetylglucosamine 3-dehydrogenase
MLARACVVGLGTMGSHHLRVLSNIPGVRVLAAVDPSERRRELVRERYPELDVRPSLEAVLQSHELEFACLAAPVEELPELAARCIEARIPVLVEKPMAPTEDEALAMVQSARKAGILLSVGYVERYNPAVVALRQRLEEGAIGRVLQFHARRLSPPPERAGMTSVALDLATHDIDVMRYLAGSDVTRVYAETAQRFQVDHDDLLCATLRFESDATGLLEVNWITPTKVRQLYVTGDEGMFVVDYLLQDLMFFENPRMATEWGALQGVRGTGEGDMVRYALPRREPLAVEWESFLAALAGQNAQLVTGEDGVTALRIAQAIQDSGRLHEVVSTMPGRHSNIAV